MLSWYRWYAEMGGPYSRAILIIGSLLLSWGLFNLRTRSRVAVLVHLGFCWLPVVVAGICCAEALIRSFAPAGMRAAEVIAALVCGVAGPVAGLAPGLLGAVQLWRIEQNEPAPSGPS